MFGVLFVCCVFSVLFLCVLPFARFYRTTEANVIEKY